MSDTKVNLIVDQGNTKVKIALFDSDSSLTFSEVLNDNASNLISKIIKDYDVDAALYAATGTQDEELKNRMKDFPKHIILNQQHRFPVEINYETENTLGLDRIANACAAAKIHTNRNVLIIDLGTCITYDFIDANGIFQGGAISPGPQLRNQSMNNYTANLPIVDLNGDNRLIGKSTDDCLRSGILSGIVFEIDGYINAIKEKHPDLTTIITGGYTNLFANAVKNAIFADSKFTLKGFNEILIANYESI